MLPGFGGMHDAPRQNWHWLTLLSSPAPESKSFVPIFRRVGTEVRYKHSILQGRTTHFGSLRHNGRTSLPVLGINPLF